MENYGSRFITMNEAIYLGCDRLFHYIKENYPNDHKRAKVHQIHMRPIARLPAKSIIVSKQIVITNVI